VGVHRGQVVANVGADVCATDNAEASHDRPVECRPVESKGSRIGLDSQLGDDLDVMKDGDVVVVCQNRGTRLARSPVKRGRAGAAVTVLAL
jgi:hypothetical protein